MAKKLTVEEWLSKHDLAIRRDDQNGQFYLFRVNGSLMQSVVLYDTAEKAITAWAKSHGVASPNFKGDIHD